MSEFFKLLGMPPQDFFENHWMKQPVLMTPPELDILFCADEKLILNWFEKYATNDERFLIFSDQDASNEAARLRLIDIIKSGGHISKKLNNVLDKESFIINKLGTTHPHQTYCKKLETFCKAIVSLNCYMTRPKSCRYVIHHDKHEIFAIQAHGVKRWKFWRPTTYLPMQMYTGYAEPPGNDEIPIIIEAHKGDVIYIPSGWRHEAEAVDGTSIHFSLGFQFYRWVDFMLAGVEERGAEVDEYRDIPPMTITENGFFYRKPDVGMVEFLFRICGISQNVADYFNGGQMTGEEIIKRVHSGMFERDIIKDPERGLIAKHHHEDGKPMKSRFDK